MLYYSEGCYNEVPVDLYAFVCKNVHESRGGGVGRGKIDKYKKGRKRIFFLLQIGKTFC